MNNYIYIVGAGGHTRSVISVLEINNYKIRGIFDNSFNTEKSEIINGYKLIGKISNIEKNMNIVLAIGDNRKREKYLSELHNQVFQPNIIHPRAYIEKNVTLGNYNQIMANVYINSSTIIGKNNILNTGCIIEHENNIGSHNHISVGSILCGRVNVGSRCLIGAGTVIIDNVKICNDVIVGANSVVINDIAVSGTYVGNPAKRLK